MSFGVVQSAIAIIKNNRSLIGKRNQLKNTLSTQNGKKVEFKGRKATAFELKRLRERIQMDNKLIMRKRILATSIVMIILIVAFLSMLK
ncbi:hypothetical protein KO566_08250 [Flavobacteriaceae bacterium XHP0103]|uniref:hypothetical protein n=1 Tax=Marixanthotalea marina TaxID=2844359 RepID=UPI002989B535|nr:hypothetical protein [Marixanthotalea marina]MBU3822047.1 hypothetical protein [Marixanthotalea marina]